MTPEILMNAPHMEVQMGIAWLLPAAAALFGIGSQIAKGKAEKSKAKESDRANRATHDVNEKARLAAQETLQQQLATRGITLPFSEGTRTARPYTGADSTKGMGWNMASGLLGTGSDIGFAAGQAGVGEQTVGGLSKADVAQLAKEAGVSPDEVEQLLAEIHADAGINKGVR